MKANRHSKFFGAATAAVLGLCASLVMAGEDPRNVYQGRADGYRNLQPGSLEDVSTAGAIRSVTVAGVPATKVWKVLEHGERVECLDCIPMVQKLLWNGNSKTREIAAWWLRRRIFGVFGPGQAYEQVVTTLQDDQDPTMRMYAANALGEFLTSASVKYVSYAAVNDEAAEVRAASVGALSRLNSEGTNGELGQAIADEDESVRLAALHASIRVNVFSDVAQVVERVSDSSELVRRRAAENLGVMRAQDAVLSLAMLSSLDNEPDQAVRAAAVASLGQIADPSGKEAVEAAQEDPDSFVRDAARIALRRF
jgi:hypothetical protein